MTAHVLVTASNELGTRKLFKKPGSGCQYGDFQPKEDKHVLLTNQEKAIHEIFHLKYRDHTLPYLF